MEKMSEAQIHESMAAYADWSETGGAIQRTYQFKDFVAAMQFVNLVADAAEGAQHHPDILVRWNKVTLTLSTHDAGGITEKDFDLAGKCDAFYIKSSPASPLPGVTPAPPTTKKKGRKQE
jgi:4a-hydroxytetrahydrobiopterin dehydratase